MRVPQHLYLPRVGTMPACDSCMFQNCTPCPQHMHTCLGCACLGLPAAMGQHLAQRSARFFDCAALRRAHRREGASRQAPCQPCGRRRPAQKARLRAMTHMASREEALPAPWKTLGATHTGATSNDTLPGGPCTRHTSSGPIPIRPKHRCAEEVGALHALLQRAVANDALQRHTLFRCSRARGCLCASPRAQSHASPTARPLRSPGNAPPLTPWCWARPWIQS